MKIIEVLNICNCVTRNSPMAEKIHIVKAGKPTLNLSKCQASFLVPLVHVGHFGGALVQANPEHRSGRLTRKMFFWAFRLNLL